MSLIKKYFSLLALLVTLGLFTTASWAEESQAPAGGPAEIISHLKQALPFLENGDVANATAHIKLARRMANEMNDSSPQLKAAKNSLFQALVQSKKGNPKKSITEINSSIESFQKL